ncbi:MAG: YkgJ family cysteine cluster protein [Planctomycetales bacterium]|nr:YkgJ family cysteine cluster protein [Planctomycetales bacterium]
MNNPIQQYYQLRSEVGQFSVKLSGVHFGHIACRKGCCECCMDLSVWPVEFYAIVEEMKAIGWPKPKLNADKECGFLDEQGGCQIYPFRPLICRTHGLPLAYWYDDTNPPGYGVMFCKKNFTGVDDIDFGSNSTLNMDTINEQLARINIVFIDENKDLSFEPTTRIELRELLTHL